MSMKLGILIPFRANVYPEAVMSWFDMLGALQQIPGLEYSYYYTMQSHVQIARTVLLHDAMRDGMDWLLWLDDDAVVPSDIVAELMHSIDKAEVIIPWTTTKQGESVTYNLAIDKTKTPPCVCIPGDAGNLFRETVGRYVGGAGFHCVLMSLRAAQAVDKITHGLPFKVDHHAEGHTSEDIWFFEHLFLAGFKVWQDCKIHVRHIGTKIV
jgi:hypothetical protein